jgi:hypothetical protein
MLANLELLNRGEGTSSAKRENRRETSKGVLLSWWCLSPKERWIHEG